MNVSPPEVSVGDTATEWFTTAFDRAPFGVALIARDGRIRIANPSFSSLIGYPTRELEQTEIAALIYPADREKMTPRYDREPDMGAPRAVEMRMVGKDGGLLWVRQSASVLTNSEGTLLFCREIGRRKLSETDASLLAAIIDSTDDAIVSKDLTGVITSWNQGAERMFGYTADEIVGSSVTRLIPDDRMQEETDILSRINMGVRIENFETVRRRKDGQLIDVSLTISPVRDSTGRIVGASKIARDITERKRDERASLLLGAIVDSSDDAIISKDLTGIITSWNKGAERIFGYRSDEIVGSSVTRLIPEDRLQEESQILSQLQKGLQVEHFETVRRCKNGTLVSVSLSISPVRDRTGTIIGASKIARDITRQKQAEDALLASESRFRQLADTMPQVVWTAKPDGSIDYCNERWYELSGFDRHLIGHPGVEALVHPGDLPEYRNQWEESVKSGAPFVVQHRLYDSREDRWRWFITRAVAIEALGRIDKWFGTATDIDEQKRSENQLRQANYELEQFAFSATHDLQEPLRTMKIYSGLLAERYENKITGQGREFLQFIGEAAARMETLVHDLLAYTQLNKLEVTSGVADSRAVFNEILADLASLIESNGAVINASLDGTVKMHPTHLRQVLQNLLTNALKYRSPDRTPEIGITSERTRSSRIIAVRDNGIGISSKYHEYIFGLFKRLHKADEYSGTGIGLAICARIMERYSGRIWVESEVGMGSAFYIEIPD